jgi:hypothetical protein
MRVTQGMTDEFGGDLAKLADFVGLDEVGLKVEADEGRGSVRLVVDSTCTRNKSIWLEAADVDSLCEMLQEKKREALR